MDVKQILSENIYKRRRKLGLTQIALAVRLSISPEALTRIEKGSIAPRLSRLDSIARNLHCSVPDLFRPYQEGHSSNAEIIVDALAGLSDDAQTTIVNLVLECARVLRGHTDES